MSKFKIVKPYKVGNSQAVRIPSAYRVKYENARVYKKSTPTSVKISYVFPKKHVPNAFSSGPWKHMNVHKVHEMWKSAGIRRDSGTRGNERWNY